MGKRKKKKHKQHATAPLSSDIIYEKKNITVLSLDYDSCGDLLFEAALENGCFQNICDAGHQSYKHGFRGAIQGARSALEDLLSTETAGADVVELCVGSARQTRRLDKYNASRNTNGLCFEMYANLAEKKYWHFNRMLFGDFVDEFRVLRAQPLKLGTAMGKLKKNKQGMYQYEEDVFADTLQAYGQDKYKTALVSQQIQAMMAQYPHDKIKFVFMDDKLDIMDALHSHFGQNNSASIPSNVQNVTLKLIHCDCGVDATLEQFARMNADQVTIIAAAKKRITCIATLPKQEQAAIASLGLFSNSNKLNKETACSSVINYGFICKAFGLIGAFLVILIIGNIMCINTPNEIEDVVEAPFRAEEEMALGLA